MFAVLLSTMVLVLWRLASLRGASRRAQAPLLIGAALAFPLTMVWLAHQALTGESPSTALSAVSSPLIGLIPLGFVAAIGWSRLRRTQASDLVVELRTAGERTLRDRLARALGRSHVGSSHTGSTMAVMSTSPASRRPCPTARAGR